MLDAQREEREKEQRQPKPKPERGPSISGGAWDEPESQHFLMKSPPNEADLKRQRQEAQRKLLDEQCKEREKEKAERKALLRQSDDSLVATPPPAAQVTGKFKGRRDPNAPFGAPPDPLPEAKSAPPPSAEPEPEPEPPESNSAPQPRVSFMMSPEPTSAPPRAALQEPSSAGVVQPHVLGGRVRPGGRALGNPQAPHVTVLPGDCSVAYGVGGGCRITSAGTDQNRPGICSPACVCLRGVGEQRAWAQCLNGTLCRVCWVLVWTVGRRKWVWAGSSGDQFPIHVSLGNPQGTIDHLSMASSPRVY